MSNDEVDIKVFDTTNDEQLWTKEETADNHFTFKSESKKFLTAIGENSVKIEGNL